MSNRVRLSLPERKADFQCQIQVRVTDINYGNHLANDKLVSYLHEARVLFFKDLGYTEFNIEGIGLIQADLMVRYQNEAFLGEMLTCSIFTTNFGTRSFEMLYQFTTIRDEQLVDIAIAKVGLVCFDYNIKSTTNIPEAFVQTIEALNK